MTVTTLRAERRMVSRIVHSRFLAKKKRDAVATISQALLVTHMGKGERSDAKRTSDKADDYDNNNDGNHAALGQVH